MAGKIFKVANIDALGEAGVLFHLGNMGIKQDEIYRLFSDIFAQNSKKSTEEEVKTKNSRLRGATYDILPEQDFFPLETKNPETTLENLQYQKDLLLRLRNIYQEEISGIWSQRYNRKRFKTINDLDKKIRALNTFIAGYTDHIRNTQKNLIDTLREEHDQEGFKSLTQQ